MAYTLFKNANVILEGHAELQKNSDVLVKDNKIQAISSEPITQAGATVIDVNNHTLMPGLIDAHTHVTGMSLSPKNISHSKEEIHAAAEMYLKNCLMNGFTTIREAGGADYHIAQLIATKAIVGPRLFYSGKALTQTGGGADFRTPSEATDLCGHVSPFSVMSVIADGVEEVRRAVRDELRKGATQVKIFSSGGVVFPSVSNPSLYEYSEEELNVIVEEARAHDTYVMAHVYSDEGVRRCIKAGVRSIEHANFITEETVVMMSQRGVYFDPTFISLVQRIESAGKNHLSESIVKNLKKSTARGKRVYHWARKHQVPIGFGTDLWGVDAQQEQLREFEIRSKLDSAANILHSATIVNAELLMQQGKLGVIAVGAYADLLVVDGNPLADVTVLLHPQKNLKLIMKDGVIYKNVLA